MELEERLSSIKTKFDPGKSFLQLLVYLGSPKHGPAEPARTWPPSTQTGSSATPRFPPSPGARRHNLKRTRQLDQAAEAGGRNQVGIFLLCNSELSILNSQAA